MFVPGKSDSDYYRACYGPDGHLVEALAYKPI